MREDSLTDMYGAAMHAQPNKRNRYRRVIGKARKDSTAKDGRRTFVGEI